MHLPPDLALSTLHHARTLARRVGQELVDLGDRLRATSDKGTGGSVDLVTLADTHSERALTTELANLFPGHRINAEEGTRLGPADSPWVWHIDPLDGTGNYSRGLPYWALSLGLAHGDTPVLGVIHAPACGLSVTAAVGVGAWQWLPGADGGDGEKGEDIPLARATPPGPVNRWVVATDWPWDLGERQRTVRLLAHLAPKIRQYKTYGSAAVDLAHLVTGKVDAYAISKIFPWDQCAGAAAAAALGYELRRWDGSPWDLRHADIAAIRPGMWPELAPGLA
jgi:myo-inositol-1(or 4)-monophosphatase